MTINCCNFCNYCIMKNITVQSNDVDDDDNDKDDDICVSDVL